MLAGTGFFSFTTVRYIPFFMIAALPVIGRSLSKGVILKVGRIVLIAVSLYGLLFFTWKEQLNIENIMSNRWVNTYEFPVSATDFILEHDIKGKIYNNFEWGGYLMWRLAPERKVFIDGRVIYEDIYEVSKLIDNAHEGDIEGIPYWKAVLNRYGVSCIIIPLVSPSGSVPELTSALLRDSEWMPVFLDRNSMIFLKDSPETYHMIQNYAFQKNYFTMALIEQYKMIIMIKPTFVQAYIAVSDFYIMLNRYEEARAWYEKVLAIAPFNIKARKMLELLNMYRSDS